MLTAMQYRWEVSMAFRPNYRFHRNERNFAKQTKKEEKLRRRQERKSQRDIAAKREPDANPPPEL
jgi:hypothetical protein